jgi:hypothetical protein
MKNKQKISNLELAKIRQKGKECKPLGYNSFGLAFTVFRVDGKKINCYPVRGVVWRVCCACDLGNMPSCPGKNLQKSASYCLLI